MPTDWQAGSKETNSLNTPNCLSFRGQFLHACDAQRIPLVAAAILLYLSSLCLDSAMADSSPSSLLCFDENGSRIARPTIY